MSGSVLTVGMAAFDDFHGCYFTIASLRAHHPHVEIVVVDSHPKGCERTKNVTEAAGGLYRHAPNLQGTSAPRDEVFRLARTPWVLCTDSHVLFESGAIGSLIEYAQDHPDSNDLIQGPMVYDNGGLTTHWSQTTPPGLWGVWDYDERGGPSDKTLTANTWTPNPSEGAGTGEPFEIPMMGLGIWAMRKSAWPGFNPIFTGFGGEEGYLHELVRRRGGKCLCLPSLRWRHRFRDPRFEPVPYPLRLEDHVWNLLVGHRELGIEGHEEAIRKDFGNRLPHGVFDALVKGAEQCQEWNVPGKRPAPMKMLGIWYTNNGAPLSLMQKSLGTIKRAQELSREEVEVVTCPWESIPGNPFAPKWEVGATYKDGPGHLNIIRQQKQAISRYRTVTSVYNGQHFTTVPNPEVICFLEHDVLYPPDYFDRVARTFREHPESPVVSNLDYEGLNATGWLGVKERHEPLHQLSMRYDAAVKNLERAEREVLESGLAEIEPDPHHRYELGGKITPLNPNRSKWTRIPPRGLMPSVHVNW